MKRVLLIDDEILSLDHTKGMIDWRGIGCEIVGTARNAEEGLKAIRESDPDIVITDIVMPGMTGLEMIGQLSPDHRARFIVISGYREFDYARPAIHAGAVDYLLKPFTAAQLREAVLSCMDRAEDAASYESRYGSTVAGLLRAIDEHLSDPELSLSWLCENELFMNETYMGRLMQKRTGMKFTAWVTQRRMAEACRLLKCDRDIPVAEVAERVGFASAKYFIEVFKKNLGVSPGQYRNGHTVI